MVTERIIIIKSVTIKYKSNTTKIFYQTTTYARLNFEYYAFSGTFQSLASTGAQKTKSLVLYYVVALTIHSF
jgi:hypothetical protein